MVAGVGDVYPCVDVQLQGLVVELDTPSNTNKDPVTLDSDESDDDSDSESQNQRHQQRELKHLEAKNTDSSPAKNGDALKLLNAWEKTPEHTTEAWREA